ncbi:MAG: hypothetical protein GXO60_02095 [Epsilonproteobacteria bacterium]|nr:hypothetical protein [Campylobacterota bacterium]
MRQLLLTLTVFLLFIGCTKTIEKVNIIKVETKSKVSDMILKLPINLSDKGYQNLQTKVIKNRNEFDKLLTEIKKQKNWDKKENFLEIIENAQINFDTENLLIYTFAEDKSVVVVAVDAPISEDKEHIIVKIGKDKTEKPTNEMAYYALAYKVKKNAKAVIFDEGSNKIKIENR